MKTLNLAFAALLLSTAPLLAQELVMSSWLPPKHPVVVNALEPWAADIEKATEGRVTVRITGKPLGTPPAHFDMAKDGIADITYGLHSFTEDNRFLRARLGQFSLLGDDAVSASKAFWQIYGGKLEAAKEHEGTKILSLWMHGPGVFHNNKIKVEKPEDFSGLKVRGSGGLCRRADDRAGGLGALHVLARGLREAVARGDRRGNLHL